MTHITPNLNCFFADPTQYTAKRTLQTRDEVQGTAEHSITIVDLAGNRLTFESTTDSSFVKIGACVVCHQLIAHAAKPRYGHPIVTGGFDQLKQQGLCGDRDTWRHDIDFISVLGSASHYSGR